MNQEVFEPDLWPITIVYDRYGDGWLAFPAEPNFIPEQINGDLYDHIELVEEHEKFIGRGLTPTAAAQNLVEKSGLYDLKSADYPELGNQHQEDWWPK